MDHLKVKFLTLLMVPRQTESSSSINHRLNSFATTRLGEINEH